MVDWVGKKDLTPDSKGKDQFAGSAASSILTVNVNPRVTIPMLKKREIFIFRTVNFQLIPSMVILV